MFTSSYSSYKYIQFILKKNNDIVKYVPVLPSKR